MTFKLLNNSPFKKKNREGSREKKPGYRTSSFLIIVAFYLIVHVAANSNSTEKRNKQTILITPIEGKEVVSHL